MVDLADNMKFSLERLMIDEQITRERNPDYQTMNLVFSFSPFVRIIMFATVPHITSKTDA